MYYSNENDIVTYDKELVSREEKKQDAALKKLYAEYKTSVARKRRMLSCCYALGHKIMPATAIWFVISYWMSGMFQYYMVDMSFNITCELCFTIFYFSALLFLNYWYTNYVNSK